MQRVQRVVVPICYCAIFPSACVFDVVYVVRITCGYLKSKSEVLYEGAVCHAVSVVGPPEECVSSIRT